MKILCKMAFFSGILATALSGCQKDSSKITSPAANKPNLTLSKPMVKEGEQLTVSVQNLPSAATIKWYLSPSAGTKIVAGKDQATAYFTSPGTYHLTAAYYLDSLSLIPYDSTTTPVIVTDTVYTPPPPTPPQFVDTTLAGKQIQIEPVMASDTGGLVLLVQTTQLYSCGAFLQTYFDPQGSTLKLYCLAVSDAGETGCPGGLNTAQSFIFIKSLANGVYNFDVILNTVTYYGTLTVTDQNYTFGWNYTSYVTISPLQMQTINTQ